MKKFAHLLALVVLLVVASSSYASADPVTITFDAPPCAAIAPGIYPGNCYQGDGVTFGSGMGGFAFPFDSNGTFTIAADPNAVSPPNVARPDPGFTMLGATFIPFGPSGTSSVGLNIVGSLPGQFPWVVQIFGTDGELARFSGTTDQQVTYCVGCSGGGILALRFFPSSPLRGIDNLTLNVTPNAPVPEPATLLLTASGILAVVRRRWIKDRFQT